MSINKKISGKLVTLIIVCAVVLVSVVFLFFINFGCSYTSKFKPENWISDQPESSRLKGCYYTWQCQFIEDEKNRKICDDRFAQDATNQLAENLIDPTPIEIDYAQPYASCGGDPYEGTCQVDGLCIDNEFEQRVYELWKKDLISRKNISEKIFNDYVEISDVEQTVFDDKISIRIQSIYKNGWVRVRNAGAVVIYSPLSIEAITDQDIQKGINFLYRGNDVKSLHTGDIMSVGQVQQFIERGYNGHPVRAHFCNIGSPETGLFLGFGSFYDPVNELCAGGSINLLDQEVQYGSHPCGIVF